MALFSSLSEKLKHVFSKLTKPGKLTELEIRAAMREVKLALLEADVNFGVVKEFINRVTEKAIGERVMTSLTPGQMVIKVVSEELTALMGSENEKLFVSPKPPSVYMMCGLQGAGKTTFCGKIALMLKGQNKRPLLVACDIYRPAAIAQLQIVGKNAGVPVYEEGTQNPVKTVKNALAFAVKNNYDTVIIDTAGRLHINDELMKELEEIKKVASPHEILLTVDSMTGQDAVNVAEQFNNRLNITGVLLTKLDGDTRGGAALSIRAITGKPIKFSGTGEKIGDIEPFHPERMAKRILGMGDVLSLIEKAESIVDEKQRQKMEKAFRENSFTLEDFLVQFESVKKMGGMEGLIASLPANVTSKLKGAQLDEYVLTKNKAIIQSMTPYERRNPDEIKASRKQRIAKGSGTTIQDINALLKQFEQSKVMMKQMKGKKGMMF